MSANLILVEKLMQEANQCLIGSDYVQTEKLCQAALQALDEMDHVQEDMMFNTLFMLCAAYYFDDEFMLAFGTGMKLLAMIEDVTMLEALQVISSQRKSFSYFLCAMSAIHIDVLRQHVSQLGGMAYALCRDNAEEQHGAGHHYSQLLMAMHVYPQAMHIAEQALVLKKKSQVEAGCNLPCYQCVYAESMVYALGAEEGIAYLDALLQSSPDNAQYYVERGKAHFILGQYDASISDCANATLFGVGHDSNHDDLIEEALWTGAMAHCLLNQHKMSVNLLNQLCLSSPNEERYFIWHALFSGDMHRLSGLTDVWVKSLASYVLGVISFEDLLSIAKKKDNRCISLAESYCFFALKQEQMIEDSEIKKLYKQCLNDVCARNHAYLWAKARLKQMK